MWKANFGPEGASIPGSARWRRDSPRRQLGAPREAHSVRLQQATHQHQQGAPLAGLGGSFGAEPPAKVAMVASGSNFNLAIDESGDVWSWGWSEYGVLGNGTDGEHNKSDSSVKISYEASSTPRRVRRLCDLKCIDVACGQYHTILVSDSGRVLAAAGAASQPAARVATAGAGAPDRRSRRRGRARHHRPPPRRRRMLWRRREVSRARLRVAREGAKRCDRRLKSPGAASLRPRDGNCRSGACRVYSV